MEKQSETSKKINKLCDKYTGIRGKIARDIFPDAVSVNSAINQLNRAIRGEIEFPEDTHLVLFKKWGVKL